MTVPVRHLAQPGPTLLPRVECVLGQANPLAFTLEPGLTLLEAVSRPLRASGFASAAVVLEGGGGGFAPFAYVLPAHAPDTTHAAWYSGMHVPPGGARLERANATLGLRDGEPLLHCHAVWVEEDGGARRAGHVLPERSVVAAPIAARAWGLSGPAFLAEPDAETNFTLFHPVAAQGAAAPPGPGTGRAAALRIRPNEDLLEALEATCHHHGIARAALRGGVGSMVGARFAEGGVVEDIATELLVTGGAIAPDAAGEPRAEVSVALADMRGRVHEGRLLRGLNPVCITFELLLEELPPA